MWNMYPLWEAACQSFVNMEHTGDEGRCTQAKADYSRLLLSCKNTGPWLISCYPGWPLTHVLGPLLPKRSASGMCHMPSYFHFSVLVFFGGFLCIELILCFLCLIMYRTGLVSHYQVTYEVFLLQLSVVIFISCVIFRFAKIGLARV